MNRFLILPLLLVMGLEFVPAPCFAVHRTSIPFTGPFNIQRIDFENGLRLLVLEDHSSPTFAYHTWFKVGSRNEVPGKTGLAHLFEHMMFKETKNLKDGEFDRLLEGAGAKGENAFTSHDYTAYIQELPASQLEMIVKAEADRMTNIVVNDKSFKTEREVVQNERRFRTENNPNGIMQQELFGLAFKKHPYLWPVIGYQTDLDRMSSQDAAAFYHRYYSPNHATIVVVGDVKTDTVQNLVTKYYAGLTPDPAPKRAIAVEPAQNQVRTKQLKLNIQADKLLIAYHTPAVTHPDMPALDVIENLLSGGKNNRLTEALVEMGIAGQVETGGMDNADPSLLNIWVVMQKGKKWKEAEQVILKEFKKLTTESVSKDELERAKNKVRFDFYNGLQSNSQKANFLGAYESLTGDFQVGLEHDKKVQEVTSADILRVAKKYFQPSSRTVIVGVAK